MSKLIEEITNNKAAVPVVTDNKEAKKALAQALLDSISGGWVNAYADWSRKF